MDLKLLNPFVDGAKIVYNHFGQNNIQKGRLEKKINLSTFRDVNIIIGIEKQLKGSVIYSMSYQTAKNIVSLMMKGKPITEFESIIKSGICEFVNMASANAATLYSKVNFTIDISPPTLIHGNNVFAMINRLDTIMLEMITPEGSVEVNIGLETSL